MTTTGTTIPTITCTKSQFGPRLSAMFYACAPDGAVAELVTVIDGLVRVAREHQGTFTGYNAYLDLAFTVTPDEDPRNPATVHFQGRDGELLCGTPARDLDEQHHRTVMSYHDADATCERCNTLAQQVIETDEITIPAVTDTQRSQARGAARATVRYVKDSLNIVLSDSDRLTASALTEMSERLAAAAGHLRIANCTDQGAVEIEHVRMHRESDGACCTD